MQKYKAKPNFDSTEHSYFRRSAEEQRVLWLDLFLEVIRLWLSFLPQFLDAWWVTINPVESLFPCFTVYVTSLIQNCTWIILHKWLLMDKVEDLPHC